MSKLKQIRQYSIILAAAALLFGCNNPEMKLDFSSAIGKYKSTSDLGVELLELKKDSTYVYTVKSDAGETYLCRGKWNGPYNDESSNFPGVAIVFYDWPYSMDLFLRNYLSEKGRAILSNDARQKRGITFKTEILALKWTYVLRRSEEDWDYDFVKQRED